MGWWQGPRGGLAWFLLLHTTESREYVLFGVAVSTYSGGESNPKGQTSLRCRLTQTAACLVGPARRLRASGA